MFEYFAGKYFVQSGVLNQNQANSVIKRLMMIEPQAAAWKIDKGLLKENQVALIQMLQNTISQKLGDLASEYEGFTDAQLNSMVSKQTEISSVFIGLLIKGGWIDESNLTTELDKFRNYYELNRPGISRNLKEDFDSILRDFFNSGDYFANEFATITLKFLLRFIGPSIRFNKSSHVKEYTAQRMIVQKAVTSKERYFIAIAADKISLQNFNDGIESSFASVFPKTRYSSLCSLINCVTNIFQCMIANEKEVLLVDEPCVYKYSTINVNENCYLMSLQIEDTKLGLLVGYGTTPNFSTITHNI